MPSKGTKRIPAARLSNISKRTHSPRTHHSLGTHSLCTHPPPVTMFPLGRARTEVKTELETEVKIEPETEVKIEPEPEVKTEPEAKVKTEPDTEVKTEPDTEPAGEAKDRCNQLAEYMIYCLIHRHIGWCRNFNESVDTDPYIKDIATIKDTPDTRKNVLILNSQFFRLAREICSRVISGEIRDGDDLGQIYPFLSVDSFTNMGGNAPLMDGASAQLGLWKAIQHYAQYYNIDEKFNDPDFQKDVANTYRPVEFLTINTMNYIARTLSLSGSIGASMFHSLIRTIVTTAPSHPHDLPSLISAQSQTKDDDNNRATDRKLAYSVVHTFYSLNWALNHLNSDKYVKYSFVNIRCVGGSYIPGLEVYYSELFRFYDIDMTKVRERAQLLIKAEMNALRRAARK